MRNSVACNLLSLEFSRSLSRNDLAQLFKKNRNHDHITYIRTNEYKMNGSQKLNSFSLLRYKIAFSKKIIFHRYIEKRIIHKKK